jgi:hypothetical protein
MEVGVMCGKMEIKEVLSLIFKPLHNIVAEIMTAIGIIEFFHPEFQKELTWSAISQSIPWYVWISVGLFIWTVGIVFELVQYSKTKSERQIEKNITAQSTNQSGGNAAVIRQNFGTVNVGALADEIQKSNPVYLEIAKLLDKVIEDLGNLANTLYSENVQRKTKLRDALTESRLRLKNYYEDTRYSFSQEAREMFEDLNTRIVSFVRYTQYENAHGKEQIYDGYENECKKLRDTIIEKLRQDLKKGNSLG